jgi:curved DNA-binding protein CbpA
MKNRRNYYRLLQVQPDAPFEVIRASYRTLMRELNLHPDRGGDHWNAVLLNEAYDTLSDSFKRAEYDRKLFEKYTMQPLPPAHRNQMPLITIFCPFCKRPLARAAESHENCLTCKSPLNQDIQRSYQRAEQRVRRSAKIRYYTTWPQAGREADMVDLSPNGLQMIAIEHLRPRLIIKLSSNLVKATAKVVYCNDARNQFGTAMQTIGVKFLTASFAEPKGSFYSKLV